MIGQQSGFPMLGYTQTTNFFQMTANSDKRILVPTRLPRKLVMFMKTWSSIIGEPLNATYQKVAEQFLIEEPWKHGMSWQYAKSCWQQVNIVLPSEMVGIIDELVEEHRVSRSAITCTMMYQWVVCPPEEDRELRKTFERIHGSPNIQDMLHEPGGQRLKTAIKKGGKKTSSGPALNIDADIVRLVDAIRQKGCAAANDEGISLALRNLNKKGVSKAELARRLGRSETWIKAAMQSVSPEAVDVARRIGVDPKHISAGELLRLVSWSKNAEKQVVLDWVAADIRSGTAYRRALLDTAEKRYELCRMFPGVFMRKDLSLEDLKRLKELIQSSSPERRKCAESVIVDGLPMPEEQLNTLTDDCRVANELLSEASKEVDEIAELRQRVFAQDEQIRLLSSRQRGMTTIGNGVSSFPDSLKTFLVDALLKQGKLTLVLDYLESFCADRVVILDSAYRSAKESDEAGFEDVGKAGELLFKLVGTYVDRMRENPQPSTGLDVFGDNRYAPGEGISNRNTQVRNARTFVGCEHPMMEHLKIGGRFSKAKTLRIHFRYDNSIGKVVIGHCGPHLL